ncbi:hypothetical protein C1H46_006937 [Malus baccata]|uniref:Uncharacterized protein n=1 Tax=Malus baccata TaxID=106549 RepID=A0A540NAF7_MALBA|nr:hypothetical protein C1H46_006937 [Malus baccata]
MKFKHFPVSGDDGNRRGSPEKKEEYSIRVDRIFLTAANGVRLVLTEYSNF